VKSIAAAEVTAALQSGLIAHSTDGALNDTDLITATYLGQRLANLAKKFG
tara:strand:+ start:2857 stop:3006 length:150 start_codon:yes stop_codon:yes gene_type:complete